MTKETVDIAYGRFVVDNQTKYNLKALAKRLGLEDEELQDDYHSTVLYSQDNIERLLAYNPNVVYPLVCNIKGYKLLGENEDCLVAELDNPDLNNIHNELIGLGAHWKYPEYVPHLTLSYNWKGSVPAKLPRFKIKFDKYKSERSTDEITVADTQLEESMSFREALNKGKIINWASRFTTSKDEVQEEVFPDLAELKSGVNVSEFISAIVKVSHPHLVGKKLSTVVDRSGFISVKVGGATADNLILDYNPKTYSIRLYKYE